MDWTGLHTINYPSISLPYSSISKKERRNEIINGLFHLPGLIKKVLEVGPQIEKLSEEVSSFLSELEIVFAY